MRPKSQKIVFIVGGVLIFVLAVTASLFFWKYTTIKSNPDTISQERTTELKDKVARLYAIPEETPTVAEISDKEKLKDQPFFKAAEKGDVLFIFPNTKIALLYRENANKLINVGPITVSEAEKQSTNQKKQ